MRRAYAFWIPAIAIVLSACAREEVPPPAANGPPPVAPVWVELGRPMRDAFGLAAPLRRGSPKWDAQRRWQIEAAAGIGLSHYRHEVLWVETERTPGVFEFPDEESLQEAAAAGQSMLGVIAYGNPLYSAEGAARHDHHYPPDDPEALRPYARAVAERYRTLISRWEFWNEPNGGYRFWMSDIGGDPVAFGTLARIGAEAVREGNPEAKLALGGLFYHDYAVVPGAPRFLEAVVAAHPDLPELYDAVSFHPYKPYPPGDPPEMEGSWDEDIVAMIRTMRETMDRLGLRGHELWITENGWPTGLLVDDRSQARYLVRGALLSFAAGVKEYDWYTFWDYESTANVLVPTEAWFGLVRPGDPALPFDYLRDGANPPQPKIGWYALAAMLAELGTADAFADITDAVDSEARPLGLRFVAARRGADLTVAAWHAGLGQGLRFAPPQIEGFALKSAVDMTGGALALEPAMQFSPSPVYLRYRPLR